MNHKQVGECLIQLNQRDLCKSRRCCSKSCCYHTNTFRAKQEVSLRRGDELVLWNLCQHTAKKFVMCGAARVGCVHLPFFQASRAPSRMFTVECLLCHNTRSRSVMLLACPSLPVFWLHQLGYLVILGQKFFTSQASVLQHPIQKPKAYLYTS